MRLNSDLNNPIFKIITVCFFAALAWSMSCAAHASTPAPHGATAKDAGDAPAPAAAAVESAPDSKKSDDKSDTYVIQPGDSLGSVALAHGVSIEDLIKLNGIENPDRINHGQSLRLPSAGETAPTTASKTPKKAPEPSVTIEIPKGINLSRVAFLYGIPVSKIVKANKLTNPNKIRSGQKIIIPGATQVVELIPKPPCYKEAVEVYRVRTDVSKKLSLCYCDGKTNEKAVAELSEITGPKGTENPFPLHPRLLQLLQKIADQYPGKRIEIVSGQRVRKSPGHESYHNKGQAMDFRVAGVSNKRLVQFIRKFKDVGVGYYPNSVFIHMDTRETSGYWVDYSRPGEKAIYGKSDWTVAKVEEIRSDREMSIEEEIADTVADTVADTLTPQASAADDNDNDNAPQAVEPASPPASNDDAQNAA